MIWDRAMTQGKSNSLSWSNPRHSTSSFTPYPIDMQEDFPGGSLVKNPSTNAGDVALITMSGRSLGGGNGNPLQCCCLKNPMDRWTWWVTVHVVHSLVSEFLQPCGLQHTKFPVLHHLPELVQAHVHWVSNAIQPSCPLSSPSPPTSNLSQHQGLF